ncbi:MAG: hypothetical protein PUC66_05050 [Erysipelotrichaceae bacterium]|nr:hypothetical protein [Erysipelotrichaceae bacterium]MDD6802423.1 hypothetical protein [Mollicutes bacterium]
MKKKFIPVLATAALIGLVGIASCGTTPTSNPGESSSTQPITPTPTTSSSTSTPDTPILAENPTLTLEGEAEYTIAAGETLALPKATAVARDGKTDLSGEISVEDYADTNSISADGKSFCSKIAGDHTLSFYVEEAVEGEDPRFDEKTIVVHVTAAHANTFEVQDSESNPEVIGTYGTYKDGFEKGMDSKLYKGLGDANHAAYLSSTEEAIEGTSLIVDFNKTSGSALNSLFVNLFTDVMLRGKPVTYEVSFDYKPLTEGASFGGIYFGQRWDGYDGTNNQFMTDKIIGKTSHYSVSFTESVVPEGGNAGFFFFKLSADTTAECKVAIDNFVVTAKKCVETTDVVPTSDELSAEGGFTFNWKEKAGKFGGKGETILVESIEDATIKAALTGREGFGENVMHFTGNDSHIFSGLNGTNLVGGKKLTISFKYYAVDDNGFNMIVMAPGGITMNDGLKMTVVEGNVKQFVWTGTLPNGITAMNFYPTNSAYNIYMGDMNVQLADADPIPEGTTALGHKVGDKWTNTKRQWGDEKKASGIELKTVDTPEAVKGQKGFGDKTSKIMLPANADTSIEWYQPGMKQMELGHDYKITVVYYVEALTAGRRFMINFDNNVFLNLDNGVGYHEYTLDWKATRSPDFFSFYFPEGGAATDVIYVASTTCKLVKIN